MKIKIGVICNGGYSGTISGGDVHILNLIEALSKNAKKYDVSIILPEQADELIRDIRKKKNARIKIIKIRERKKINKKQDLIGAYFHRAKKTFGILKKQDFNLIITANPFFCDILPLLGIDKKNGRIKIVSWIFHVLPKRKADNFKDLMINTLASLQEKICFKIIEKKADLIFTCNNIEKHKIKNRIKNNRVEVGGIGINTESVDKIKVRKKKNTALFVGRLVRQKGIYDLIEIMERIRKKKKISKLNIIGGGPEKDNLMKEIYQRKLEKNISVLGFVDEEKKTRIMKEVEYFFFPSYEEGFGIVIAEALYCQCKVICYELKHYKELFQNFPEYVKPGDIKSFVMAMRRKKNLQVQKKFMKEYDYRKRIKGDVELIEKLIR